MSNDSRLGEKIQQRIVWDMNRAWDRYSRRAQQGEREHCIFQYTHFPMAEITGDMEDPLLVKRFNPFVRAEFNRSCIHLKEPCYLLADTGGVLTKRFEYLGHATGRVWPEQTTRPLGHLRTLLTQRRYEVIDRAISFCFVHAINYWHFFNDVLGKMVVLKQAGIDIEAYPLLISRQLYEMPFFAEAVRSKDLARLRWTPIEGIVICKELIYTFDVGFNPENYRANAGYFRFLTPPASTPARLFIGRRPRTDEGVKRIAENDDQIQLLLKRKGYTTIYNEDYSFPEQVRLFANATHIVGYHGAGLTNIMLRGDRPLHLIEIFAPYGGPHYKHVSMHLGYTYRYVRYEQPGQQEYRAPTATETGYRIDLDKLDALLTTPH